MIIRALHVEHWRCIGKLDLEGLETGIIILHGPNKTGKSSLVGAIRCCLFDLDHDVGNKLKKNIPWNGKGPPKVAIEFQTGSGEFRLTKVFSKRADGLALLEKKVGAEWQVEENSPKEASRKTREMLDADKSTGGLNQLLWLEQGEIGLPKSGDLDDSLERRLVSVLGVLVTGSDLAFKQALDERHKKWFTEGGKYKQNSTVSALEHQIQELSKLRDQERQKFSELEQTLHHMEICLDELPLLQRQVQSAQEDAQRLEEERNRTLERRTRYAEAEKALERAQQDLSHGEQALSNFRQAQSRCQESEREVERLRNAVQEEQLEKEELDRQYSEKQQSVARARAREETHQQAGEEIDDRRKHVSTLQKQSQLQESLAGIKTLERETQELEEKIKNTSAPDETGLEELRENRRKAHELRAQLKAEALTMTVSISKPARIFLTLENKDKETVELMTGEKKSWSVRQRAEMEFAEWGKIELARSHENLDLERADRRLSKLERDFDDSVRAVEEDPLDEKCLDRLSERKFCRDSWQTRLTTLRNQLAKAPQGRGVLEGECARLETLRQTILQRRPGLAQWLPDENEVERLQVTYSEQAMTLRDARVQMEADEEQARRNLKEADTKLQEHKGALRGATATALANQQEQLRLGDGALLLAAVENAITHKTEAENNLAETSLTEDEKTIDQRCDLAQEVLRQRQERVHQMEIQLGQLSGLLKGNEGLHIRLADAEAAVEEADSALARERLEAQAHRRLLELFESSRESQVKRVMKPIGGRVLEWARRIGLNDYQEVRFGDKFLPEGLLRQSTSLENAIAIDDESYGTGEQLSLLVRLALGGILAKSEPAVAILDDPLAHADSAKHRKVLDILRIAAEGNSAWNPPAGPLQIIILTCHPDRFDYLSGARHYDLARLICK